MKQSFAGNFNGGRALLAAAWLGALYGVLQLQYLDLAARWHLSLCGPWGCGPAIEALAAWHGFWLVLLLPATPCLATQLPAKLLRRAAWVTTLASLVLLIGIVSFTAYRWLLEAAPENRGFLIQRCGFVLFYELSDFPLLQLLLCGITGLVAGRRRARGEESRWRDVSA